MYSRPDRAGMFSPFALRAPRAPSRAVRLYGVARSRAGERSEDGVEIDSRRLAEGGPQIAHLGEATAHVVDREVPRAQAAIVELLPREGCRHRSTLDGAGAVHGGQGLSADVLQAVDVDAGAAPSRPPHDRGQIRMALCHEGADQLAEEAARLVRRPRGQGDEDVDPVRARRLGEARHPVADELV